MCIFITAAWVAILLLGDQSDNRYNALVERIEQLEADRPTGRIGE
jgi:hypothetical protein